MPWMQYFHFYYNNLTFFFDKLLVESQFVKRKILFSPYIDLKRHEIEL